MLSSQKPIKVEQNQQTKCAPSYANVFMGAFEERHIYPRILHKTRIFLGYIDDLFFIENELQQFLEEIIQVHPTIKFDYEISKTEEHFLDITIYKDTNGKLATKLFTKPTDRQAYLHRDSAHPYHLKKSIPYGQTLRLRRLCSDDTEFNKAGEQLTKTFISRGYNESEIKIQIDRTACQDRNELLRYKDRTLKAKIPCILTYNTQLPNIKGAINKHWNILKINPRLETIFNKKPIMAFRRNRNLWDIIGQKTIYMKKCYEKYI